MKTPTAIIIFLIYAFTAVGIGLLAEKFLEMEGREVYQSVLIGVALFIAITNKFNK